MSLAELDLIAPVRKVDGTLAAWLDLFCRRSILGNLRDEEAEEVIKEVEAMCEVDLKDEDGNWAMMYTRLRFHALKA